MREQTVVFLYSRHEDAVRAFRDRSESMKGYLDMEFRITDLTISGQGIIYRFMAADRVSLRGLNIDKIFFDDVGPFWSDDKVRQFKKFSEIE